MLKIQGTRHFGQHTTLQQAHDTLANTRHFRKHATLWPAHDTLASMRHFGQHTTLSQACDTLASARYFGKHATPQLDCILTTYILFFDTHIFIYDSIWDSDNYRRVFSYTDWRVIIQQFTFRWFKVPIYRRTTPVCLCVYIRVVPGPSSLHGTKFTCKNSLNLWIHSLKLCERSIHSSGNLFWELIITKSVF